MGRVRRDDRLFDGRSKQLRDPYNGHQTYEQQSEAEPGRARVGWCRMLLESRPVVLHTGGRGRQEIVAVLDRLDEDEHRIQHEGAQARKHELRDRERRARSAGGEYGKDERHHGQRDQHRQCRPRPLDSKRLLSVARRAREQAQPDHPVADDHDRGEERVARKLGARLASRQHQGHDQRSFDNRDRQGEHQRAEGLAHFVGHDLGVMYACDHRAEQSHEEQ